VVNPHSKKPNRFYKTPLVLLAVPLPTLLFFLASQPDYSTLFFLQKPRSCANTSKLKSTQSYVYIIQVMVATYGLIDLIFKGVERPITGYYAK